MVTHKGGCHCGRVRFELDAPEVLALVQCNCSICSMQGFLHHVVSRDRFRLISGADVLTEYTFGTGVAKHPFCSVCGIRSFYQPRAFPEGISVNVNCLDPGTVKDMKVTRTFDGLNWEESVQDGEYVPSS